MPILASLPGPLFERILPATFDPRGLQQQSRAEENLGTRLCPYHVYDYNSELHTNHSFHTIVIENSTMDEGEGLTKSQHSHC